MKLFSLGAPCAYVAAMEDDEFANLYLRLTEAHRGSIIRTIRGWKSRTVDSFFDEISAALQFPYYFGENTAAFDECITDLDWIEGDAYLLMVSRADDFMAEASSYQFNGFMELFAKANVDWLTPNQYIPRTRQPTPFHLLFQCVRLNESPIIQRLRDGGIAFEIL
ncbi:MAG: barstar family protein [Candidatus Sulfotelmatobacter sp.]